MDLTYCRAAAFVPAGLAYWSDNSGRPLHVLNLQTGAARQISLSGAEKESVSDFLASGGEWNPETGELFAARQISTEPPQLCAIRLRDGRLRRIGTAADEVRFSSGYQRMACALWKALPGYDASAHRVWTSSSDGRQRKPLTTGRLLDWTDPAHLLITREGSARPESRVALFRADVSSGALQFLADYSARTATAVSPSRQWVAVAEGESVRLISSSNGRWSRVPSAQVTGVFWGRTDEELFVNGKEGWRQLKVRIGTSTSVAASPTPERFPVRSGHLQGSPWMPLPVTSGPWRVYHAATATRSVARVSGRTWLGTTDGLRIMNEQGVESPVPGWASGLRGRSVEQIVLDGPIAWLVARRVAPFNGPRNWESALIRVDLHTGKARQRYLDPSGFGGDQYLTTLAPGSAPITLERPRGVVRRWEERGMTELHGLDVDGEQPLTASVAIRGRDGAIWLGMNTGLLRQPPGEGHATTWTERHGLAAAAVLSAAEHDGRIWLGTAAGLSVLAPQSGTIQRLTAPETLGQEPVLQLLVSGNTLYARGDGWLAERNSRTGGWTRWPTPALMGLYTNGHLLARFGENGPLKEWLGQGRWKPLTTGGPPRMAANATSRLLQVEDTLWCGHPHAVSRLDLRTGSWRRASLPRGGYQVQSLVSAYGSLWAGLWKGGVLELDPATGAVRRRYLKVPGEEKQEDADSHLIVYDLTADGGELFANTSSGWHRLDRKSGHARRLSSNVMGKVVGKVGRTLWVLGDEAALGSGPGLTELALPTLNSTPHAGFPGTPMETSALGSGGIVWSVGSEVVGRNRKGQTVAGYPVPRRYRDLSVRAVTWSGGYLWYAAEGQGSPVPYQPVLLRIRLSDGEWQELPACPLSGVQQLLVARGSLWAATWNGVAQLPLSGFSPAALPHPERAGLSPQQEVFAALPATGAHT